MNFPNEEAERAAMQHLIDRGCRNIAIVGHRFAPRADLAHAQNAFALRLRGACGALSDAGLPYDESMVFEAGDVPMASSPGMRLRNVFSPHGADMVAPSSTARAAPTISRRSA